MRFAAVSRAAFLANASQGASPPPPGGGSMSPNEVMTKLLEISVGARLRGGLALWL